MRVLAANLRYVTHGTQVFSATTEIAGFLRTPQMVRSIKSSLVLIRAAVVFQKLIFASDPKEILHIVHQ